jgi:hypothetical protein
VAIETQPPARSMLARDGADFVEADRLRAGGERVALTFEDGGAS